MYTFTLDGETPAKKNSRQMLPNGKNIPGKAYNAWNTAAVLALNVQRIKQGIRPPIACAVVVHITFTHGDYHRRDSDNAASSILDALQNADVLSDDNWRIVHDIYVHNRYEKGAPRCEIEIEPVTVE